MINNLRLSNFQRHSFANLSFSEGINVITGPSDSGKSSFIRALRLLFLNRPGGDSFLKTGEDKVSCSFEIRGAKIERLKGGGENCYFLNGEKFTAFGSSVPEQIKENTFFDDINLQLQMDSPFLLSLSPGEASRYINKILKLDMIDFVLSNAESIKRREERAVESLEESAKGIELELEAYGWLESAECDLNILEKRKEALEDLMQNRSSLKLSCFKIIKWNREISVIKKKVGLEGFTGSLIFKERENSNKLAKYSGCYETVNKIRKIEERVSFFLKIIDLKEDVSYLEDCVLFLRGKKKELKRLKNIKGKIADFCSRKKEIEKLFFSFDSLEFFLAKERELEKLKSFSKQLVQIIARLKKVYKSIARLKKESFGFEEDYLKYLPEVCPVCNRKIKK